ncbi:MAG: DEAD/DEAH box helicase [Verrucomicrobiota bacterium]
MSNFQLDYWRLKASEKCKSYQGLDAFIFSLHGKYKRRKSSLKYFLELAKKAQHIAERNESITDKEVVSRLKNLRLHFLKFPATDKAVAEGLAMLVLGAKRALQLSPYPVQLASAASLFHGYLAEMATGEGKTLTVALAATLMGSTGRPCHVITANDYLASRDSQEMEALFRFFGLSVGSVTGHMPANEREKSYAAHITYTTPKEALADFLRDRIALSTPYDPTRRLIRNLAKRQNRHQSVVMRGLHFAIVDEADSVLIDEAVTPLIISQRVRNKDLESASIHAKKLIAPLKRGQDYQVDFKFREISIVSQINDRLFSKASILPAAWRNRERFHDLIRTALIAREFYLKDVHYAINEGKIELIDEFTGRIMEHRTWQQGLHQAVEAKENVEITPPNESIASMSFQRFFRCYPNLSGLSGTAYESKEELWQIYHLAVLKIPTHRPALRKRYPDQIFASQNDKWKAVACEAKKLHQKDRPLLIGTRSVQSSELVAKHLSKMGLQFEILNALRQEDEAQIISKAGQLGRITIATNMAGRGTDIKLGHGVRELGGLHVIATEIHESSRIDRQLIGRSGRQGDPGSARFIVSINDELTLRFLPLSLLKAVGGTLPKPLPSWIIHLFAWAQWMASSMAFKTRKRVLKHDTWLDENLSFSGKSSAV